MGVFIIAEAGVNHNGVADQALAMVETAARSGADAIKFQTFSAVKLVGPSAAKAAYQKRETGDGGQMEMLSALEMSEELHRRLFDRCGELGIEFMSTPFDEDSADFLISLGMKRLKIPSGELTNHPFLRFLAAKGLPLILSTGMGTMEEVEEAVAVIESTRAAAGITVPLPEALTILHCTSNYPAASSEVNLRAMGSIAERTGLPVGYSDHTLGTAVAIAAVARGAQVIEKHFTLDSTLPGPDHRASLEPDQLVAMVTQIREVEEALGSDVKAPSPAELEVRAVARRSISAARPLDAGHRLKPGDLVLLRPASGIAPKHFEEVLGRTLSRAIEVGTPLRWTDLA